MGLDDGAPKGPRCADERQEPGRSWACNHAIIFSTSNSHFPVFYYIHSLTGNVLYHVPPRQLGRDHRLEPGC